MRSHFLIVVREKHRRFNSHGNAKYFKWIFKFFAKKSSGNWAAPQGNPDNQQSKKVTI